MLSMVIMVIFLSYFKIDCDDLCFSYKLQNEINKFWWGNWKYLCSFYKTCILTLCRWPCSTPTDLRRSTVMEPLPSGPRFQNKLHPLSWQSFQKNLKGWPCATQGGCSQGSSQERLQFQKWGEELERCGIDQSRMSSPTVPPAFHS